MVRSVKGRRPGPADLPSTIFPPPAIPPPWISVEEMIEVDRLMVEELGIDLVQMMENAGRCLAHLSRVRFLHPGPRRKRVVVLAGGGGNGGGGMVAARRLAGWDAEVTVVTTTPIDDDTIAARQRLILERIGMTVVDPGMLGGLRTPDLVLDAVIGYSLRGSPSGRAAEMIRWCLEVDAPVVSLDVPSGLDADSGEARQPAVRPDATLTLALPKRGLAAAPVGELYLADIGVPPTLYRRLGYEVGALFTASEIVRLR